MTRKQDRWASPNWERVRAIAEYVCSPSRNSAHTRARPLKSGLTSALSSERVRLLGDSGLHGCRWTITRHKHRQQPGLGCRSRYRDRHGHAVRRQARLPVRVTHAKGTCQHAAEGSALWRCTRCVVSLPLAGHRDHRCRCVDAQPRRRLSASYVQRHHNRLHDAACRVT